MAALSKMLLGECLKQQSATESWIDIPGELWELYAHADIESTLYLIVAGILFACGYILFVV